MSSLPAATAVHPKAYRFINNTMPKLRRAKLLPPPDLDENRLFKQARFCARFDDFGDEAGWLDAMRALIAALRDEPSLNAFGQMMAHGSILKVLYDRLRAEALFKASPEIRDRPLAAPIIICGSMRSGTTRLQRLLACDPRFRHMQLYEMLNPVPWKRSYTAKVDPRVGFATRGVNFLNWVNPRNGEVHPTGALEADEETGLLEHSFWGAQIEAQRRIPSFARYCETADPLPAYRRFADLLRVANWFAKDNPARPWLLKSPQYLQDLPAMTSVLPGARLIFMDRDPAELVASGCSLVWNQMVVQSDDVDPRWIGQEWLAKTALRQSRAAEFRTAYPANLHISLGFEAMNRDWRGEIARIYDWLDLPLSGDLLSSMEAYLSRAAAEHGFARHKYRLEDFGLTRADVDAVMKGPVLSCA